jgi:hypothetical protein
MATEHRGARRSVPQVSGSAWRARPELHEPAAASAATGDERSVAPVPSTTDARASSGRRSSNRSESGEPPRPPVASAVAPPPAPRVRRRRTRPADTVRSVAGCGWRRWRDRRSPRPCRARGRARCQRASRQREDATSRSRPPAPRARRSRRRPPGT